MKKIFLLSGLMTALLCPCVLRGGEAFAGLAPLAASFSVTDVAPRVFSPDEASPSANRVRFFFANPDGNEVTIRIFDAAGAVVRRTIERESEYVMFWDGRDDSGKTVKSGIYIYQIEAGIQIINGAVVVSK